MYRLSIHFLFLNIPSRATINKTMILSIDIRRCFLSLSLSIWPSMYRQKGCATRYSLCSIISSCRIHGELTVAGGSRHDDNNRETSRCRVQRDESRGIETFLFANYLYVFQLDSANVMVFEFRQKSTIEWSRKMENFIIFFIRILLHIDNSWWATVSIERYIYSI